MQHAWSAEDEDLEVVELLRSISQSQEVPTEAYLRESPAPISCQMRLVLGGKGTTPCLQVTTVGDGWYLYSASQSSTDTMNLKNCIG